MWTGSPWDWAIVVPLYLLGIGLFHLLGGIGSAGQAFERWGRESSARRRAKVTARWRERRERP